MGEEERGWLGSPPCGGGWNWFLHTFSLAGRMWLLSSYPEGRPAEPSSVSRELGLLILHLPPGIVHPVQSVTSSPGALGHED